MNIFYIIGVVVVVVLIAGFLGLRVWTSNSKLRPDRAALLVLPGSPQNDRPVTDPVLPDSGRPW